MKKILIILCVFIISQNSNAQIPEQLTLDKMGSMKSPDVSAFESIGFLPINEYTGRMEVNIPIYNIDFEGVSIPISISYNTGGVKVNTPSSRVGLNWNLNAGGVISRDIKGDDDFSASSSYSDGCLVYTRLGFLNSLINNTPITSTQPSTVDRQPDIFIVSSPEISTQFTHKADGSAFELTPTGAKIDNYINDEIKRFQTMKITAPSGIEYTFSERESTWSMFSMFYNGTHESIGLNAWDVNTNINDAINITNTWNAGTKLSNTFSSLQLTSIHSPITGRSVTFEYDENYLLDYNRRIERSYKMDGSFNSQTDYIHDLTKEKILKKITFPGGSIQFFYNTDRNDLVGAQRLIRIEVKDNSNQIIKKAHFVQDYFTSINSTCIEPQCLRLRLKEVYFEGSDNSVLPSYTFSYNETKLPPRYSYKQDFLGYANGVNVTSTTSYRPIIYKKENQGKDSFIPFNITGLGYLSLSGNYSLESNLTNTKAAALEMITYPTGGYTTFNYELNCFKFLNREICGGGLRISYQKLFDHSTLLKKQIGYTYLDINGITSGSILFIPKHIKGASSGNNPITINQVSVNPYELTSNSYVGYSRVKIADIGNGYTVNEYLAPKDEPNIYPSWMFVNTSSFTNYDDFNYELNNGIIPKLFQNMEIKRGKLLSSKIYNQNNSLVKETVNEYTYKIFEEIGVGEATSLNHNIDYLCDLYYEPYGLFTSKLKSERNLLTKSTQRDFFSNGELISESLFTYDLNNPFIKEKSIKVNNNKTLKEKYLYPYDVELSGLPEMVTLKNQNIISKPIKSESYLDTDILSTQYTDYKDWGNNLILPETIQISKGIIPLKNSIIYYNYDNKGNPTELSKADGPHIVYIWGYQQTQPIAKIENATYASIPFATITNLQTLSDADNDNTINEGILRTALNNLRTALPNAMVTTYTYDPLIGITSITDPKGETIYYHYDNFNRLEYVLDKDGKVLGKNEYHYKNQQ